MSLNFAQNLYYGIICIFHSYIAFAANNGLLQCVTFSLADHHIDVLVSKCQWLNSDKLVCTRTYCVTGACARRRCPYRVAYAGNLLREHRVITKKFNIGQNITLFFVRT